MRYPFTRASSAYRVEVPPRLWPRLEALDARLFTLVHSQLQSISELAAIQPLRHAAGLGELRFQVETLEVFYSVDDDRRRVIVRDVRRVEPEL